MDPDKWRIKKVHKVWRLYAPGEARSRAGGSWLFCVHRFKEIQMLGKLEQSTRWRDG
jgi:hypothetical protein